MEGVGLSIGETNKRNLAARRMKKGECPTCGNKTHKVTFFGKRTALTREGICLHGRCLLCNPVEGYMKRGTNPSASLVPRTLTLERQAEMADDGTMVSGITMDHRLIVGERNWNGVYRDDEFYDGQDEQSNSFQHRPYVRPDASVGGGDEIRPPQRHASLSRPIKPTRHASQPIPHMTELIDNSRPDSDNHHSAGLVSSASHHGRAHADYEPPPAFGQTQDPFHAPSHDSFIASNESKTEVQFAQEEFVIQGNQEYVPQDGGFHTKYKERPSKPMDIAPPPSILLSSASDRPHPAKMPGRPLPTRNSISSAPMSSYPSQAKRIDSIRSRKHHSTSPIPRSKEGSIWANAQPPLVRTRGLPDDETDVVVAARPVAARKIAGSRKRAAGKKSDGANVSGSRQVAGNKSDEIPKILSNIDDKVQAFKSLRDIVLSEGQTAKIMLRDHSGLSVLVSTMWEDMQDEAIQEAACNLLFALSASVDGNPEKDILRGPESEGAVDALLIIMQTHLQHQKIQIAGCGALYCLAASSGANREINDGTLSGAILSVVSAMSMHQDNSEVQEWGIRALYSQCMLSANAESNQKSLADSENDGISVIYKAMTTAKEDLVTVELSCRLYWCLSSNDDICKVLTATPNAVETMIKTIKGFHKRPEAAATTEAAYGALANLARLGTDNHYLYRDIGIIAKAVDSLQAFSYDEELYVEACGLLGVLAANPDNKQAMLDKDAVGVLARIIQHFSHNQILREEALYALFLLCIGSDRAKKAVSSDSTVGILVKLVKEKKSTIHLLEICCSLMTSLAVMEKGANTLITHGAIDGLLNLLEAHPQERKLLDSVFSALRNLSGHAGGVDKFTKSEIIQSIMFRMKSSVESEAIQLSCCGIIWNIYARAKKIPSAIIDIGGSGTVVTAMQKHMEAGSVLEMACGALWSMTSESDDVKKDMISSGAIDAVTCALVMHPAKVPTLETACGLLASVCTKDNLADAIKEYQGIGMVVEAMRNNSSAMRLLEISCLLLRNLVLMNPDNAVEASACVSTVVNAMKESPDAIGFQREACNVLWALAAQSEDCKSKILALDGITTLMGSMDTHGSDQDIQEAARGAWLALSEQS